MATIDERIIEDIRTRIDLAELIASYGVQIRRAGSAYTACCPFHHEKTPSFHIRPERGMYHCFGCGESGDCFKFVMKQEGLTFVEAVKKLAAQVGVKVEEKADPQAALRSRLYTLHTELAAFFRRCLKTAPEAEAARAYLQSRALSDDIAESFLIGYAPKSAEAMLTWATKHGFAPEELAAAGVLLPPTAEMSRWYNRFGGRLMFSIRDRAGRVVAFSGRILTNDKKKAKYVNSPETEIFRKSNILYAFDKAAGAIAKDPNREAIVCEGQIDVIRCHASGFPTAVASQGTAFTEEHVHILKRCADAVVLVFDADGAGEKAAFRTGGEFLAAGIPVRVATLPPGEDPDSLLRTQGPDAFRAILAAAESITRFQVKKLRAREAHPDTVDAVRRVSRAVLETIAKCSGAVMRAALLKEAAELMGLPLAALEMDLTQIGPDHRVARTSRVTPQAQGTVSPDAQTVLTEIPDDAPTHIVGERPPEPLPSLVEKALCEFLFPIEPATRIGKNNTPIGEVVQKYLPTCVLDHAFTIGFLNAWRDAGNWGAFREDLSPTLTRVLDDIIFKADRTLTVESSPAVHFEELLRAVWVAALQRKRGVLSISEDEKLYKVSMLITKFRRAPLARILPLMIPATLDV